MKKTKGEITTEQIVLLIILLVSFIVILFLLFRLDLGKQSEDKVCHNSVVMRGTSGVPSDAAPLKCSRNYVCLTKDGSCEKMTKPEIKKVKTEDEVYQVLADEMADCWWMFGEGKVDYVGKDFFFKDNYCSICSQVAFDDSLKDIDGIGDKINKLNFYEYLSKTPLPGEDITYSEYLFKTKSIRSLFGETLSGENGEETTIRSFGSIEMDKQYFVLMGITSEVAGRGWKIAAGGVIATVGFFIPGPGWTWSGAILGALIVGAGEVTQGIEPEISAIIIPGDGIKNNFMAPTIQEANSETLSKLNCYDIITSS